MALWEGFEDCLTDFRDRSEHPTRIVEFFGDFKQDLQLDKVKTFLSIGPGPGNIDHGIAKMMPHLESYTAVEPDVDLVESISKLFGEFESVEKHFVHAKFEDYTGPKDQVDFILMSHVAYHFPGSFSDQLKRAKSWLKPNGGKLVVIHDKENMEYRLAKVIDNCGGGAMISDDDIRGYLNDIGVTFKEMEVDYTVDITNPGPTNYGFISVFLNRQATKEELQVALKHLRGYCIPGTDKIKVIQAVFIIET